MVRCVRISSTFVSVSSPSLREDRFSTPDASFPSTFKSHPSHLSIHPSIHASHIVSARSSLSSSSHGKKGSGRERNTDTESEDQHALASAICPENATVAPERPHRSCGSWLRLRTPATCRTCRKSLPPYVSYMVAGCRLAGGCLYSWM